MRLRPLSVQDEYLIDQNHKCRSKNWSQDTLRFKIDKFSQEMGSFSQIYHRQENPFDSTARLNPDDTRTDGILRLRVDDGMTDEVDGKNRPSVSGILLTGFGALSRFLAPSSCRNHATVSGIRRLHDRSIWHRSREAPGSRRQPSSLWIWRATRKMVSRSQRWTGSLSRRGCQAWNASTRGSGNG